jgi:hypothetical protein
MAGLGSRCELPYIRIAQRHLMPNNTFESDRGTSWAASGRGTAIVAGRSTRSLDVTNQVRGKVGGIYSTRARHAPRNLPLRCRDCRATFGARKGHRLQLLHLPPLGSALGLLRVRHRPDHRPSREHAGVHPRRQDAHNCALRDMWLRYALGAVSSRAWQAPRSEPPELRPEGVGVRANSTPRWRGHLEVLGLSGSDA